MTRSCLPILLVVRIPIVVVTRQTPIYRTNTTRRYDNMIFLMTRSMRPRVSLYIYLILHHAGIQYVYYNNDVVKI